MAVKNEPLVSIVSPCYNSAEYIGRMLGSILAQTHSNIEMICVDDGSTDNTVSAINSYRSQFDGKGMRLTLLKQPHSGQAAAVNLGLKAVNGEYLSWIDSDDFLTANSIEKKLIALNNNSDCAVVTSDFYVVNEEDIGRIIRRQGECFGKLNYQPFQFYLALGGMSIIESNCHLIRTSDFESVHTNREIHTCVEGQNFQIMLPLYYRFKRCYVNEPLAYYVIRDGSHYHKNRNDDEWRERNIILAEMLIDVLSKIGLTKFEIERCVRISIFVRDERS